jgi:hypothetical protein
MPYEMISILSEARRKIYMTRFQRRLGIGGWLVQQKSEINPAYESVLRLIEKSFTPTETFENDRWLVVRYEPNGRP